MKLFEQMKTNEREMLLSMLAHETEKNMKRLVAETIFDSDCQFNFFDVLDLADYLGSRWGIDFRTMCFDELKKEGE